MWSDVAIYYRIKSTKKNGGFVKFFGAFLILLVISMQFGGANMLGVARAQIDGTTVVDPATPPAANETTVPASDPVVAPPAPEEAPAPAVDIPIDTPVTPPAADTTTPEENNQVNNETSTSAVSDTSTPSISDILVSDVTPSDTQVSATTVPTLSTDKDDYHPGETATIFGKFFGALQHIVLKFFGSDANGGQYTETTQDVTTDDQGSFTTSYTLDSVLRPFYNLIANDDQGNKVAEGMFYDSDTGLVAPTTTVASSGVTNPNNGWASDNAFVTYSTSADIADYSFPNLGIPTGATIDGIEVMIEARHSVRYPFHCTPSSSFCIVSLLWRVANSFGGMRSAV